MIFDHPSFDDHERVLFAGDPASGLRAVIAVHSTRAGPACGGVRRWAYARQDDALDDALRLSRGMTYKTVMAGLPLGGGKAVISAAPGHAKSRAEMLAFGRAVESLGGLYVAAEDVGITTGDMAVMREATAHVAGLDGGAHASGDPSPHTARGVFLGIKAALAFRHGSDDLAGARVAVLGLGAVGGRLAALLRAAGAHLVVADVVPARVAAAVEGLGAVASTPDRLAFEAADVFAPCALGRAVTRGVALRSPAGIVAGGANNQLATPECGAVLHGRGVLYAPDYVINAGGIINVAGEVTGAYDPGAVAAAVGRIPATLAEIFARSRATGRPTSEVADGIARERLAALGTASAA